MKLYAVLAGIALAGLVVAFSAHRWMVDVSGPGMTSLGAFLDATPVVKLIMILCLMLLIAAVVLSLVGALSSPGGEMPVVLVIIAAAAVAFGILGAAYSEMNIQIAVSNVGPVSPAVIAPGRAEWLLCLSIGFLAGFIGFASAAWQRARHVREADAATG
jgi:hypothetical protein